MTPQPRHIKDGPFAWQSKAANRKIRDAFDASRNVSSALVIYMALTEIASDEASETFDKTVGYIAVKAGVSTRTVTTISPGLQDIRLVSIRENTIPGSKLKGPNTYTLLPIGNNCASIRNGRKQPALPRIEEKEKNPKKNIVEEAAGKKPPSAATTTNLEDLLAELKQKRPELNIDYEVDRCKRHYAKQGIQITETILRRWIQRAEPLLKRPKLRPKISLPPSLATPWDDKLGKQIAKNIREFRKKMLNNPG
jgi:hypothetical protein